MRGVRPRGGAVDTPVVVNAAGPAAARVARLAGVHVPVLPAAATSSTPSRSPSCRARCRSPPTGGSGFYFRKELDAVLLAPAT